MSARRLASVVASLALSCAGFARGRTGEDAEARVRELLEARDLGGALAACDTIADPTTRAEWRFHVLHGGGDFDGALRAALDGLRGSPGHPGLSNNALICAFKLRRAETAAAVRAQMSSVSEELAGEVERLVELERAAANRTRRARFVALGGLLATAAAMLGLARRSAG